MADVAKCRADIFRHVANMSSDTSMSRQNWRSRHPTNPTKTTTATNLTTVAATLESTGEMAAMVVACIERKPEGLGIGDESQVLSNVVQNGLKTG